MEDDGELSVPDAARLVDVSEAFVEKACNAVGVPAIRLRDQRHRLATLALPAGVYKVVQEQLGHAGIDITLDLILARGPSRSPGRRRPHRRPVVGLTVAVNLAVSCLPLR